VMLTVSSYRIFVRCEVAAVVDFLYNTRFVVDLLDLLYSWLYNKTTSERETRLDLAIKLKQGARDMAKWARKQSDSQSIKTNLGLLCPKERCHSNPVSNFAKC